MSIDFHSAGNRNTYATRDADAGWAAAMREIVAPAGTRVADIGCGGGIYTRAWAALGAATVTGVDFSARMVADARAASAGLPGVSVVQGDAAATGLPDASIDVVFSRAVIHHLPALGPAVAEAYRILAPGGTLIVQDRTFEDVLHPASPAHLRGYFFEVFPRLLDTERDRRPATVDVTRAMAGAGFSGIATTTLAETRRTYNSLPELQADLRKRTGRSILHALDDAELERLIDHISGRVGSHFPLVEHDPWTIWSATKPAGTTR
ncbi:MAG TPA: class I SAM-dependent methyltransferase [Thermomicrobiales bacterium]|nr:class I SAM-dependent methyltransferase [Thermomicrobiales bacterium]